MLEKLYKHKTEVFVVLILLVISGLSHSFNMFHFPYYESDEGTYMSQAWSLLRQGELAPYTYWYDHAPAGWILISLWVRLTGGFFTFGTSVDSGRAFMLVLHLATTVLLYYIAKKLTKKRLAGIIAVLIFSLSPLAIYFQRRVLLDNMMTFWIMASIALLVVDKLKLKNVIISAITFGIAVLTKESAVFFAPAFIYLVLTRTHKSHKSFALVNWLLLSGLVISVYILYAFLKNELFPPGMIGGDGDHVSLISTLQLQLSRGKSLPFWEPESDFYVNLAEWMKKDPFLVVVGGISTVVGILLSLKDSKFVLPTMLSVLFVIFLIRGGLIIDFYMIPLVPIFALLIGMILDYLLTKLTFMFRVSNKTLSIPAVLFIATFLYNIQIGQYSKDETAPQREAVSWIKENLDEDAFIVIDNSIYVDLHEPGYINDKVYPHAEWSWKVEKDVEIREEKLSNDWRKIDYIVLSHEILRQLKLFDNDFIVNAFENSVLVDEWNDGSTSHVNLDMYISTNGDWMSMYRIVDESRITLNQSWKYYNDNFIVSYGQVVDPSSGETTSEGQSYAMLRAIWMNDKKTFDGVWAWTRDHMQHRGEDSLLSWLWDGEKITDPSTASDADEDIALALIFAHRKWGDEKYLTQAREIIVDIWENEVVAISGRLLLTSGSDSKRPEGYLVNPSYLSPATYRIFASIDNSRAWGKLADDSYIFLEEIGSLNGNLRLPPNWVIVTTRGELLPATKYYQNDAEVYGYDAFRTFWRVSLDEIWFGSENAKNYLSKYQKFFENAWGEDNEFKAIYALDGGDRVEYSSLSTNVAPLVLLKTKNPSLAKQIFDSKFSNQFNYEDGYWGEKNNYYDQNWAWFGTAFYTDNLPKI